MVIQCYYDYSLLYDLCKQIPACFPNAGLKPACIVHSATKTHVYTLLLLLPFFSSIRHRIIFFRLFYILSSENMYGKMTTHAFQKTSMDWMMARGNFQSPDTLPIVSHMTSHMANNATEKKW